MTGVSPFPRLKLYHSPNREIGHLDFFSICESGMPYTPHGPSSSPFSDKDPDKTGPVTTPTWLLINVQLVVLYRALRESLRAASSANIQINTCA
jgi:hypothetical protein